MRDLFAYIKTLPPVQGKVRGHDLPFPFNIRRTLGVWKLLFLGSDTFQPDPARSAQWNRGAYLVNGPGHCAECHSPRNVLGGIIGKLRFTGGPNPEGEGWVPNITQKGIDDWSEKDIAYMLETGNTPDGDSVGGSMAAVVRNTASASAARPRRDGSLCQIAAAGGEPEPAGEEIAYRRAVIARRALASPE